MTRTLVISDTHMPRGRLTSEKPLLGLLAECDRLVVNGDLAELHQPGLIERSKHLVDALREQAAASNTTLELLAGNHDPEISRWRGLGFADNRLIITHGDAFHMMIAPWARHALTIKRAWTETRNAHQAEAELVEHRFDAVRAAALAEWDAESEEATFTTLGSVARRPDAILKILRYWQKAPEHARLFAQTFFPEAEYLVVGHTHRAGISKRKKPVVINTGAFSFPGRPHAVLLEGNRIQVVPLRLQKELWMPVFKRPRYEQTLPDAGVLTGRWGIPEGSGDLDHAHD